MQHDGRGCTLYRYGTTLVQSFENSNFGLDVLLRSGSSVEVDVDLLSRLIEEDLRLSSQHFAEQLRCSYNAVENI